MKRQIVFLTTLSFALIIYLVYDVHSKRIIIENYKNQNEYLQPIITQYFIDNKSEIWLLFLIAHSKR